jgi:hypothetical protein
MVRYFEDLQCGRVYEFGAKTISREEIVEFAERYDSQPFRLEESGSQGSVCDETIASRWRTVCLATWDDRRRRDDRRGPHGRSRRRGLPVATPGTSW